MQAQASQRVKLALILIAVVWVILWGMTCVFPGLTFGNVILMSCVVAIAVLVPAYGNFGGRSAISVIAVVVGMLGIGVILNSYLFTIKLGGNPAHPVLLNIDFDRWWNDALYHLGDEQGVQAPVSHGYYGYVLAGALWLFGKTVGAALIWSMMNTLATVLVVGAMTYRLTRERTFGAISMVCVACVCYLLCMGTVILKDSFFIFAITLGAYGMTFRGRKFVLLVLLAALMIMMSRRTYLLMFIVGIGIVAVNRRNYILPAICAAVCLIMWYLPEYLGFYSGYEFIITHDEKTMISYDSEQQMAFYNIIGDYKELSFFKRILYLPFCMVVQFFIPFPWNFTRDFDGGYTMLYAHISYPWYAFGYVTIYYIISRIKTYRSALYRLAVWGVLCWLLPCYLFGGTISRYTLCCVPLLASAVAVTVYNNRKSKKFYILFAIFAVAACVTLLVAHHLQSSAVVE